MFFNNTHDQDHPSLTFEGKSEAYPARASYKTPLNGLTHNLAQKYQIRTEVTGNDVTNALAYYNSELITAGKSFKDEAQNWILKVGMARIDIKEI